MYVRMYVYVYASVCVCVYVCTCACVRPLAFSLPKYVQVLVFALTHASGDTTLYLHPMQVSMFACLSDHNSGDHHGTKQEQQKKLSTAFALLLTSVRQQYQRHLSLVVLLTYSW